MVRSRSRSRAAAGRAACHSQGATATVRTPWVQPRHTLLAPVSRHVGSLALRDDLGNSHPGNTVSINTRKSRSPPPGRRVRSPTAPFLHLEIGALLLPHSCKGPSYTVTPDPHPRGIASPWLLSLCNTPQVPPTHPLQEKQTFLALGAPSRAAHPPQPRLSEEDPRPERITTEPTTAGRSLRTGRHRALSVACPGERSLCTWEKMCIRRAGDEVFYKCSRT